MEIENSNSTETPASPTLTLTADIVSAYVSNNAVPVAELPALIDRVNAALVSLSAAAQPAEEQQKPATSVKKSIANDYIICLEDGKKFKSLKRHLMTHHSMTPEEYREKWNLPRDYPMVAPAYAAARSTLAKEMGLGRKPAVTSEPEKAPAKRGRKPKTA
ncbi:transcriptional regulator [Pseudaminobacter arsenicus]|uniref:Transcriptional regulator n=1 Tax=Borborobacter arsenicus TaxID=1851146 RepID=A0A432V265_9HYPH|nr:MucR family transcriptional regulator [Pseudaminobacter arsenicus]RUM96279.1 transcriptional regulator [Pseudaminobacter arsenicus]